MVVILTDFRGTHSSYFPWRVTIEISMVSCKRQHTGNHETSLEIRALSSAREKMQVWGDLDLFVVPCLLPGMAKKLTHRNAKCKFINVKMLEIMISSTSFLHYSPETLDFGTPHSYVILFPNTCA